MNVRGVTGFGRNLRSVGVWGQTGKVGTEADEDDDAVVSAAGAVEGGGIGVNCSPSWTVRRGALGLKSNATSRIGGGVV